MKPRVSGRWLKDAATIGLVAALSLGVLDVAKNVVYGADRIEFFSLFLAPLLATAGVVFIGYLVAWFLVVAPLGRLLQLDTVPLAVALACFAWPLSLLMNILGFSLAAPAGLLRTLNGLLISLLSAVGCYFAAKSIAGNERVSRIAVALFLALPLLLAEALPFAWLHMHRLGGLASILSLLVTLGFGVLFLLTFVLFYRFRNTAFPRVLLVVFAVSVALAPAIALVSDRQEDVAKTVSTRQHSIKNVVLITIDTLRRDALSCYGSAGVSTPNIDRLADDSIVFNRAISPSSWTLPALASIMTGLSPTIHGTNRLRSKLPKAMPTLAEHMRDDGYHCSALVTNGILSGKNLSKGFSEFRVFAPSAHGRAFGEKVLRRLFPAEYQTQVTASDLTRMSVDWLEANRDKDNFFWVHYIDPHLPYTPPAGLVPAAKPPRDLSKQFMHQTAKRVSLDIAESEAQRAWLQALYSSEVRYLDDYVGKLIDALVRLGLYEQSLIVFTSDHGEEFWDHGGFEHGHTLYDELIGVPLMVKLPGSEATGPRENFVSIESVMPTIMGLCEVDYEDEGIEHGSLAPLWGTEPDSFVGRPIVSTGLLFYEEKVSIIFDEFKYIHSLVTGEEELYNMRDDPAERHCIAKESPDLVERARSMLAAHDEMAEEARERLDLRPDAMDAETIKKLKSLGYM